MHTKTVAELRAMRGTPQADAAFEELCRRVEVAEEREAEVRYNAARAMNGRIMKIMECRYRLALRSCATEYANLSRLYSMR